jgi:predicted DCC family thiol-disulfide oxidoreductase YuxK
MPLNEKNAPILIYDAECRLCVWSKEWIEKWDRRSQILFLPFQTAVAKRLAPELEGMTCMDAMRFIGPDGSISAGVDAFRKMLPFLPMGRSISLFFYLPGFSRLAWKIYGHVAENRYRWFGRAHSEK